MLSPVELIADGPAAVLFGWETALEVAGLPFHRAPAPSGRAAVAIGFDPKLTNPGGVALIDAGPGAGPRIEASLICWRGKHVAVRGPVVLDDPTPCPAGLGASVHGIVDETGEAGGPALPLLRRSGDVWTLTIALGILSACSGTVFRSLPGLSASDERVELPLPAVDRAEILRLMGQIVVAALRAQGVPLVQKAKAPDGATSVLLTRIDIDTPTPEACALLEGKALTLFVNTSGEQGFEDRGALPPPDLWARAVPPLRALAAQGQEIACHGHRHSVAHDPQELLKDLVQALRHLSALATPIEGYGGPGGIWTPALPAALMRAGLAYSSELSAGCETWPQRAGPGSDRWQIGVSPRMQVAVALGISDIETRWRAIVRALIAHDAPVSLILHPEELPRLGTTISALQEIAQQAGARPMTFGAFRRFWAERNDARLRMERWRDRWHIETTAPVDLAVEGRATRLEHARTLSPVDCLAGMEAV